MLTAVACGPDSNVATPSPTVAQPTTSVPSSLPGLNPTPDPGPIVNAALNDAATQLGVSAANLHVEQVEPRQWPDSSLGCARPGLMYSQIVTPGFLIVISSGSTRLEYHTDTRSNVVLCNQS
jgi:hypothetical protein